MLENLLHAIDIISVCMYIYITSLNKNRFIVLRILSNIRMLLKRLTTT